MLTMRHLWRLKVKTVLKMSMVISSCLLKSEHCFPFDFLYSSTFRSNNSISWYNAMNVPVRPTPAEQWTSIFTWFWFLLATNCLSCLTITRIESVVGGAEWSGHPTYCRWRKRCILDSSKIFLNMFYFYIIKGCIQKYKRRYKIWYRYKHGSCKSDNAYDILWVFYR